MSVRAMIRRQRTKVTVVRGTAITALNGNRTIGAPWTTVSTDVAMNIQDPTEERIRTVFGAGLVVDAVGYTDPNTLEEGDRLLVTAGPFDGDKYVVEKRVRHRQGSRNDHDEIAMASTTEVFG